MTKFKFFRKFKLRIILIIPFVLQITLAIGLVSYLSFHSSQIAINDLASQLRTELTARIERELKGYFTTPHHINLLNSAAFLQGDFNFKNPQNLTQMLQQMKISPFILTVYCGTEQGEFIGSGFDNPLVDPSIYFFVVNDATKYNFYRYNIDSQGNKLEFVSNDGFYPTKERPWYQSAIQSKKPTWSEVYLDFHTLLPTITAATPVYNQEGKSLGVCAVDVSMPSTFRQFLSSLKIGKTGSAFVIDRSGQIMSSSTNEDLTIGTGEQAQLVQAIHSSEPLIKETALYLKTEFNNFQDIQSSQQLNFSVKGEKFFVQVLPFHDDKGLDWLIVVTLPESDFMAEIAANARQTFALTIAALLIALVIGILTTRWIIRPIKRLTFASVEIASGNLKQNIPPSPIIELETLGNSFNSMAQQLYVYFNTLKLREKQLEDLLDSYGRFVPHEYLQFLGKESIVDVDLGDYICKDMAVMFSDIRSFTTISERMSPQEIFDFINTYLSYVSPEIRSHNGIIVKFLGDGVMALFPNGADDAIAAGIAQAKKVEEYNQEREKLGLLPIHVGMAIHVGNIMMGMVGEKNRIEGDILSDHVNLTARLEGLTKYYGSTFLISENVLNALKKPEKYQIRFLDQVIVKGRTTAIKVYDVLDAENNLVKIAKLKSLLYFESALKYYQQGDFFQAKIIFGKVLKVNPTDQAVHLYLERIEELSQDFNLKNWSGVWTFDNK